MAQGGISAIEDYQSDVSIQSSLFWLPAGMMRDTFGVNRIAGIFDLRVEFDFLPEFQEIQDNGVTRTILPFGTAVSSKIWLFHNETFALDFTAFVGLENSGGLNQFYPWGILGRVQLSPLDFLHLGLLAGYANDGTLKLEEAAAFDLGNLTLIPAFEYSDLKGRIKLGAHLNLGQSFAILCGINTTLFYEKIEGSLGVNLKNIQLFGTQAEFTFASTLNQLLQATVGMEFQFHFSSVSLKDIHKKKRHERRTWY